jgi:hypothetical protein
MGEVYNHSLETDEVLPAELELLPAGSGVDWDTWPAPLDISIGQLYTDPECESQSG